ncbi:hypothetical protein LXA43DRAFT_1090982 [Ganoderma leucocontextum]|nr:hypothetical protein LXA43DRAFT_1090982 [Ganoderma leucocontextum]
MSSSRPYSCSSIGCSAAFGNAISRGNHERRCPHRVTGIRKHQEELGAILQANKRPRLHTPEIGDEGEWEDIDVAMGDVELPPAEVPPPSPPALDPAPSSPVAMSTRVGRRVRIPKKLEDMVPSSRHALPSQYAPVIPPRSPSPEPSPTTPSSSSVSSEEEQDEFESVPNAFGVFRRYFREPQQMPEDDGVLEEVCDAPGLEGSNATSSAGYTSVYWLSRTVAVDVDDTQVVDYGPFANASQFRLFDYFYDRTEVRSHDAFDDLLHVLRSDGFSVDDLEGFSARKGDHALEEWVGRPGSVFSKDDGWLQSSVEIPLPPPKTDRLASEATAHTFKVTGIIHRSLRALIEGVVQDTVSRFAHKYHWHPHKMYWVPLGSEPCTSSPTSSQSSSSPCSEPSSTPSSSPQHDSASLRPSPIRVYTECFNTDAMLEADAEIRRKPRVEGDDPAVEYVSLPLLFWSDATHLSSFGAAFLWPIYLYFGNLSKYIRGRPTEFAAQHLAYIPDLPDSIKDAYMKAYGQAPTADVLTFCKRELFNRIWLLLLDEAFMEIYEHGIKVMCGDGVVRRIFPRFFTYSADYPEKMLIAALKPLGRCLCPRCLTTKDQVADAGTHQDECRCARTRTDDHPLHAAISRARGWIFEGHRVTSKHVKDQLDTRSLNPIRNAFSTRFATQDSDFSSYELLAPDLMHEFELGVWKGTFAHLMRLLAAQGDGAVETFNSRMRRMPTFGCDRIRRFWHDVASRKKLAARDYEAFLQTIMPAFEGLLPLRDDQTIADLLFELANWHALAKLRLHTDITLNTFRAATKTMYEAVRTFAATTCANHATHELPNEAQARARRNTKQASHISSTARPRRVHYNVINTFKYHSLGDYPDWIVRSGPTDNYTTQVGELEHRHVKQFYARTNKVGYTIQIARKQRKRALLRRIRETDTFIPLSEQKRRKKDATRAHAEARACTRPHAAEPLELSMPVDRYSISKSQCSAIILPRWLSEHRSDPATTDFRSLLIQHLLERFLGRQDQDSDPFTEGEKDAIQIYKDRLYRHKVLRVNYTTYDMRREQDSINPRTHPDIMVFSRETSDDDPFWYARVLDIFHAKVRYLGPGSTSATRQWQDINFLWVRWFERDAHYNAGFAHRRLPRLQFLDANDPDSSAFGFIDLYDVVRASYIIPAFAHGVREDLLAGPSPLARRDGSDDDWCYYHVCMWVDRDMYMRFLGGGIGHRSTWDGTQASRRHAERAPRKSGATRTHSKAVSVEEDSQSRSSGSDSEHAGSDGEREGSDGEHEGLEVENEGADVGDIDIGSEPESSDSESESSTDDDEDGSDKDVNGDTNDGEDAMVDMMYAPMGFAPL